MKENIVTGKKYRVLINEKDDEWDRVSFWTSSADVECENGEDMETRSEKLQGVCLTQTLSAGATTITFTDPSITKDCFIDFYTDAYGVITEDIRDGDKIEIKIYNNKPKSVLEIKDK